MFQLKNQRSESKIVCGFSITLILYYFKVKECMHFLEKKTLIKMKRSRKWKIPLTVFERRALCFSSHKNCELKVELWWVRAHEKKEGFFVPSIFSEGNFYNIYILSQCIVYWYILLHIKKHYFLTFLLVFKIVETLPCIFKNTIRYRFFPVNVTKFLRASIL